MLNTFLWWYAAMTFWVWGFGTGILMMEKSCFRGQFMVAGLICGLSWPGLIVYLGYRHLQRIINGGEKQ